MRISDWSSDVCSSDLRVAGILRRRVLAEGREDLDLLAELDRVGQRQGAGINLAGHRRHGRGIAAAVGHELEVCAGGFAESEHTDRGRVRQAAYRDIDGALIAPVDPLIEAM